MQNWYICRVEWSVVRGHGDHSECGCCVTGSAGVSVSGAGGVGEHATGSGAGGVGEHATGGQNAGEGGCAVRAGV